MRPCSRDQACGLSAQSTARRSRKKHETLNDRPHQNNDGCGGGAGAANRAASVRDRRGMRACAGLTSPYCESLARGDRRRAAGDADLAVDPHKSATAVPRPEGRSIHFS
jgi:hypothetical protein